MENTSDSFKPGPLLFCMKIERSVCYKVTDNSIPADIYEAAEIDGANYFQRIRKITIPMMKNTIVINTILIITGGFKIFETVKQLTNGGPNHMSDVLVTYMYDTTFTSSRYGYGMAVATVSFVLCLIFSIIYLVNVGKSLEQKEG